MKFFGKIGYFVGSMETRPGIFEELVEEYDYFGDVTRDTRSLEDREKANFDISVQNSIGIVADAYANEHFYDMRYVRWSGALWVISEVEVRRPRLILRLGGVYNGPTGGTPSAA